MPIKTVPTPSLKSHLVLTDLCNMLTFSTPMSSTPSSNLLTPRLKLNLPMVPSKEPLNKSVTTTKTTTEKPLSSRNSTLTPKKETSKVVLLARSLPSSTSSKPDSTNPLKTLRKMKSELLTTSPTGWTRLMMNWLPSKLMKRERTNTLLSWKLTSKSLKEPPKNAKRDTNKLLTPLPPPKLTCKPRLTSTTPKLREETVKSKSWKNVSESSRARSKPSDKLLKRMLLAKVLKDSNENYFYKMIVP
mmetsp:Transcript_1352/g.1225  ORF Transcript_1352/g.1225 Transcript_1352/m.1225 type:complete len:245 (+) Transcript_1352:559-1293(+)